jgi:hypothetical protein
MTWSYADADLAVTETPLCFEEGTPSSICSEADRHQSLNLLAGHEPCHADRVADHVGWAEFALGTIRQCRQLPSVQSLAYRGARAS